MTDITPLIGIAGSAIADFSIGFVKLSVVGGEEEATPAGSGTLVMVDSIHGILTAAHVLDQLPDHGKVGLIRFTNNTIQKQTIDMSWAEKLAVRGSGNEADGPDIGFLRLASNQVATLNATNVFFNLTKRAELVLGNGHPSSEYFEGVSGIIAEWTTEHSTGEAGFGRLKGFRGLFGVGLVARSREMDEYDLVDFEVTYNEVSKVPFNYQGWSGGALWRMYIKTDDNGHPSVIDKRIYGVAFHQSELVDGHRTITCHGPKSVYGALIQAIRNKWAAAVEAISRSPVIESARATEHMRGPVETIQKPSSELRAAFEAWLTTAYRSGTRVVVLEGLTSSGKSFLTERPFSVGAGQSTNIEIDQFLRKPVPSTLHYCEAIDRAALHGAIQAAVETAPLVVIEGPIAWPLVEPFWGVSRDRVRRVYLKRMMRLKPDFWTDEDYLNDRNYWPPTDYHRSIYRYHSECRPWVEADLVLEREEE